MNFALVKNTARKTLTGFMAVWLSGVVFLICCESMNVRAMDTEFCPLAAKSSHCDKALGEETSPNVAELSATDNIECCAFLPFLFDNDRKLERVEQPASASQPALPVRFNIRSIGFERVTFAVFTPHLADRQETYIRNRVFRI